MEPDLGPATGPTPRARARGVGASQPAFLQKPYRPPTADPPHLQRLDDLLVAKFQQTLLITDLRISGLVDISQRATIACTDQHFCGVAHWLDACDFCSGAWSCGRAINPPNISPQWMSAGGASAFRWPTDARRAWSVGPPLTRSRLPGSARLDAEQTRPLFPIVCG